VPQLMATLVGVLVVFAIMSPTALANPVEPTMVDLSSDPASSRVGDWMRLTAEIDGTPWEWGNRYEITIEDESDGTRVADCSATTRCSNLVGNDWWRNLDPEPRHFRARLLDTWSANAVVASKSLAVDVAQHRFDVALSFTNRQEVEGTVYFKAKASIQEPLYGTGYSLRIYDVHNGLWASCSESCQTTEQIVTAGTLYRAVIEDDQHHVFGSSHWFSVGPDTADDLNLAGIDLAALLTMLRSSADVCLAIAVAPSTNFTESSLKDAGVACESARAEGATAEEAFRAALKVGGGAVAAALMFVETASDGTLPTEPSPPTPPIPGQPEPPTTLPRYWDEPIDAATAQIETLNPDLALTRAEVKEIAKRCAWLASQAALSTSDCGRAGLPLFVTGGAATMQASKHDLNAIGSRPSWMQLNYDGVEKSRSWLASDGRCAGLTGGNTGMQCHEYPYNKTEQGGQSSDPSIAPIPSFDNQSQGGSWGVGIISCAMRPAQSSDARGDAFLVVPVPVDTLPTFWLCNGKSASSQPTQPPATGG